MPELDSLTLRLELDLSGLRRGLREANQLVVQSSRSMIQSLAGVEESLRRIGDMSANLQPPVGRPERRISARDRIAGGSAGLTVATLALTFAGPISFPIRSTTLLASTAMGAFAPDAEALLSNALSGSTPKDRLTELEERINQLQSMQGIRTGIELGDAIREKELAKKIGRLQLERSELLRQLDEQPVLRETSGLGIGGVFSGTDSVGTLIGGTGDNVSHTIERVEELGAAFEGADTMARNFSEAQSSALETITQKSEETRDSFRNLNSAARDLGFTFASSFEDAVVEGRRLSDVLQGLEQDILRILTRKLVTEPLAGAATGLIGSGIGVFAGEFHGGGRVGSASISDRVVPASFFAGAPRFAGGGLVGRVPRLASGEVPAILHRGETVRTPAQEASLRRNGGGGETRIVVNIQTPNPRAFNESRGQIQAMLADAVQAGRRNR